MAKLISADCVEKLAKSGQKVMYIAEGTIITSLAKDMADDMGIEFVVGEAPVAAPCCEAPAPAAAPAACSDTWECCGQTLTGNFCPTCGAAKPVAGGGIDSNVIYNALKALMEKGMLDQVMNVCGQDVPYVSEKSCDGAVKLVKSSTAKWLPLFEEAPLADKVFYNELVNADDGSQINAGFITIDNCDFPWVTECQEMYYIVEGTLVITKGDKKFTATAGDVMFFECGAELTFASPDKMKAFYCTH
ncbi:MAG: DUF861 domain-containing protein [Eubacterium sp.]|nr:DUF861 domain-containing protein [Candidatus Colimonas fimequi]